MKAVVIGGSGQIGGWILRHLRDRGHEAVGTYATAAFEGLVRLDTADRRGAARWIREQDPDVVFYPAGFTWVDGCERDPERAAAANIYQPLAVARVAADVHARFVYFSTDYVFDGTSGPNAEHDPPNPLSVYGRSKRDAEHLLEHELGEALLTIRTSWVFGPERQGKNFAYQLARTLAGDKPLICPSDQVSNPSYGPDVALAAVQLAELGTSGAVHVVGPERLPRDAFARILAAGLGFDPSRIIAQPTAALSQAASRPLQGGLRTTRLAAFLRTLMRPLDDAVADFRDRLRSPDGFADPTLAA